MIQSSHYLSSMGERQDKQLVPQKLGSLCTSLCQKLPHTALLRADCALNMSQLIKTFMGFLGIALITLQHTG